MSMLKSVLRDQFRMLCFLPIKPDLKNHYRAYLVMGLFFTWLAGVGRYWDHPRPEVWQQLGLGSVGYIFILAFIIWIAFIPLRPKNWSYSNVLLFISMASLPAILYAIPVERMVEMATAQQINLWFLKVVAAWRVLLLLVFLKRTTGLDLASAIVGTLLPMALTITILGMLNLDHAVFEIMAGLREKMPVQTGGEASHHLLIMTSLLSIVSSPILLLLFSLRVYFRRKNDLSEDINHVDP